LCAMPTIQYSAAHNTVLGEEALLIYIVPVCYVKTGRYGKT